MVISLYSKVTVTPSSVSVDTNKPTTFAATVDGAAKTAGVNWTVQPSSGASVTSGGVFTAPRAGTYQVIATSVVDKTKSAAATVPLTDARRLQRDRRPVHRLAPDGGSARLAALAAEDIARSVIRGWSSCSCRYRL